MLKQQPLLNLPNYQILDCLHTGSKTIVYRATRISDSQSVILKILQNQYPSFDELLQFRNQYTITKYLKIPGIVRPDSLEPYNNSYILTMADCGGMSLQEYVQKYSLTFVEILNIAIQLAEILHNLHHARIIHKDIKPANILIHPISKQIWLIDFSIASLLPRETQEIQNPNVLEGTLAYIAPEQTGRMNRGIDYRTDFYSLGITLYELFTGKLPFQVNEPMELVHCHLAKPALLINQIKSDIPIILSQIVAKLMAKNAEDRYQSAMGLKHDLEQCLIQWKDSGKIVEFQLGQRDLSDRFNIPEKLYGRDSEVQILLDAFERTAEGNSEMMLVAGFSGIGKTAVVNVVHKPITRQKGYFIKGKFDQFNRNIPLSAFVQAFRDLVGQLLCESDTQLAQWQDNITEALGENGQVLIEVIPELELIIGQQPSVTELSGSAAQNRFNRLFQKFVEIFTTKDHPLVIFLDDLQWADSASLELIKLLMNNSHYLLMLGAYRDNEVSATHPFILTVEELKKAEAVVNTITLKPLTFEDSNHLIADTLNCSIQLAQPLTELINHKTKGNPFFTTQFLKALYEDGHITFNRDHRYWECDIVQVKTLALTDDVVEFMAVQLQKLPAETQQILKLASAIGNQFDLNTLAIVSEQLPTDAATALWKALQEGLILPTTKVYKFFQDVEQSNTEDTVNPKYRFLHDRVQQAAYSLIPENQKQLTHLQIGQLLLKNSSDSDREEKLFDIVNHLNIAQSLITQSEPRQQLTELNLAAGHKAKSATAYNAAVAYLTTGIKLLEDNCWHAQYTLTLALHEAAAEAMYLNGAFEQLDTIVDATLESAHSLLDKITIYETQIQADLAQNKLSKAIETALNVLKQLGINLPQTPNKIQTLLGLAKTKLILTGKKTQDLIHLPTMTHPEKLAAMRILSSALSAAYTGAPKLLPLVVFEQVNLSVKYGNMPLSAFAYTWYGAILCGVVMDIDGGYEFGQLAIALLERFQAQNLRCKTVFMLNCFIAHWKQPLTSTVARIREAYQSGVETGDLEYAAWSAMTASMHSLLSGYELSDLEQSLHHYGEAISQSKQKNALVYNNIHHQCVYNLIGKAQEPSILDGPYYSVAQDVQGQIETGDHIGLYFSYVDQLYLKYLFGNFESAIKTSNQFKEYEDAGTAASPNVPLCLYDSLTRLAVYFNATKTERKELLHQVTKNQKKLKKWADFAPMNSLHKWHLVEAEKCRVLGQKTQAIELYDCAITGAKENGYIQDEALANELVAKFYLEWGKKKIAVGYMIEAYYCYARWGAKAKTDQLEKQYPSLLSPILQQQQQTHLDTLHTFTKTSSQSYQSTNSTSTHLLDITSVIKASQVLSGEIELDKLMTKLMQVILENAGATKGVLIFNRDEKLTIEAVATQSLEVDKNISIDRNTIAVENSLEVPIKPINSVKRYLQPIVIDEVMKQSQWAADEYLIQQQPKSLLCLPILNHGKLLAILYLENRLMTQAFTPERVDVLKLLCSQAAISLENAELYRKSQNYAHQLEQSLTQLQEAQVQLVQSEKMSALGEMMSGITHEINNPLGFISGNINQVEETTTDLLSYLELYQQYHPPGEEVTAYGSEIELEYLLEDLPEMVTSMKTGVNRIQDISKSMRIFSRADQDNKVEFDLHEGLDSTLLILKHRLKANDKRPEIKVIKDYGNFPKINGFPGQLNQVFMNILANAIDVFDEMSQKQLIAEIKQNPYQITLKTELDSTQKSVNIQIKDNGCGMPEAVKNKIFEHLYTTKVVGKGTGLGLSIARQIVIDKHKGKLECHSTVGVGTEFIIQLPINH
ncbi:MAG: AAA family ATPase [Microcoleaceae cyanobacterium]